MTFQPTSAKEGKILLSQRVQEFLFRVSQLHFTKFDPTSVSNTDVTVHYVL